MTLVQDVGINVGLVGTRFTQGANGQPDFATETKPRQTSWPQSLHFKILPVESLLQMNHEPPLWLIVTGPPAAGKTTLVRRLAKDLSIPLFEKDTIKDLLYETLGFGDKDWSRQVAPIAIDMVFFAANKLLRNGVSVATESNFYRQFNSERASELASNIDAMIVQVHCSAPPEILVERNLARLHPPNFRPNHHVMPSEELLGKLASGMWEPLDVSSTVIRVDTSNPFDYAKLLQTIRPGPLACPPPSPT